MELTVDLDALWRWWNRQRSGETQHVQTWPRS